ncbi:MAG TPA: hypothetical protein VEZ70_07785 [Allosphingosinicella sp.]|nr:hypothetical protein [Allosphingosinicella sp.]
MTDEPDLQDGGLSVWVIGRQFPNASDYWDGNWLTVRARMDASGATVECGGAILMTSDTDRFRLELESLDATLAGEATLVSYEPNLKATPEVMTLGHIEFEVAITPDHLNQFHRFSVDLDQSHLPPLIDACERILERFPVVGAP